MSRFVFYYIRNNQSATKPKIVGLVDCQELVPQSQRTVTDDSPAMNPPPTPPKIIPSSQPQQSGNNKMIELGKKSLNNVQTEKRSSNEWSTNFFVKEPKFVKSASIQESSSQHQQQAGSQGQQKYFPRVEFLRIDNDAENTGSSSENKDFDIKSFMLSFNLSFIQFVNENPAKITFEVAFNRMDRFWVQGKSCRLLLSGVLRLHLPCLEVIYGLRRLTITKTTKVDIFADKTIDLYTTVDSNEPLYSRSQLFFAFHPKMISSGSGQKGVSPLTWSSYHKLQQQVSTISQYLIYHRCSVRFLPVAIHHGKLVPLSQSERDSQKNLVLDPKLQDEESELQVKIPMNKSNSKDREYLFKHSSLINLDFDGSSSAIVCDAKPTAQFLVRNGMTSIAGHLVIKCSPNKFELIFGKCDVIIRAGKFHLFIGNYYMFLQSCDNPDQDISSKISIIRREKF